ncbi:hypothetical protein EC991_007644 [Linnemannia zychae]|nr:hypothetical protein EC991_007644 [Linnemannia zychae]
MSGYLFVLVWILDPLRIAAAPGITLDIVVKGQSDRKELSMAQLQEALPVASQESNAASTVTAPNSTSTNPRRNPAGGLVEKAMDAYRDNENPAFGPKPRGPQGLENETPSFSTNDMPPTPPGSMSTPGTPSQLGSDSSSSNDFHEMIKKAKLGDMDSQHALGKMYYFGGSGVEQDYHVAMDWYTKAASQGHAGAQNYIGFMYQHGQGVPQDYTAAMNWFLKASDQGLGSAQNNVGFLYRYGHGVSQDYAAAMEWYLMAADSGYPVAFNNIGALYSHGLGVPQSYSIAMEWYRKAADRGSSNAQYNIGVMFQSGQGVPKDIAAAKEWYSMAAAGGHASAAEILEELGYDGEEQKQDTP